MRARQAIHYRQAVEDEKKHVDDAVFIERKAAEHQLSYQADRDQRHLRGMRTKLRHKTRPKEVQGTDAGPELAVVVKSEGSHKGLNIYM